MQPCPTTGDGLERRSLTGTARLRRANKSLLHARMARHRLPRHLARERYVVAALRAACRSETGAPSQRTVRSGLRRGALRGIAEGAAIGRGVGGGARVRRRSGHPHGDRRRVEEFRRASVPALRVRVRAARGRRGRTWSVDRVFNATMLCAQKSFSARIGRYVRESAPATANFFEPLLVLVDAMGSNLRRHLFDHRYRFMACSSEAADGGPQVRVPESWGTHILSPMPSKRT